MKEKLKFGSAKLLILMKIDGELLPMSASRTLKSRASRQADLFVATVQILVSGKQEMVLKTKVCFLDLCLEMDQGLRRT